MRTSSHGSAAGRARVEAHCERHARGVGCRQGEVGLLELSLRLVDEARDPLVREALGKVMKGRERRDEHLAAAAAMRSSRSGLAVEREAVLDRVDSLLDREPGAGEPFGVGGDAQAEAVGFVDDRRELLAGQLRRLGVLALDRARARRHDLDEVGAAAKLARAPPGACFHGPVGLAVHRPEHAAAGRRRGDDPSAREDPRARSTRPSSTARRITMASSSFDPTSRIVVTPLASSARQERASRR